MSAVELVVTDLDGTFWHTDDHVPQPVLDAVSELAARGIPLLVATGRRPNTACLGLEAAGIATGRKGEIVVDRAMVSDRLKTIVEDEDLRRYIL